MNNLGALDLSHLSERLSGDIVTLVAAIATFGVVLSLWLIGMIVWARRRRTHGDELRERLEQPIQRDEGERTLRLWVEGADVTTTVSTGFARLGWMARLDALRRDAGLTMPTVSLLMLAAGSSLAVGTVLFALTTRIAPGAVGSGVVLVVLTAWVKKRAFSRATLFERQFVDALELSARALRAGHPLLAAFQLIAEEIPAPVGTLFSDLCQQQAMGLSMELALRQLARTSGKADMQLFSASLAIHMKTGGNLADVMDGLALVTRQRLKLQRRFKVLVAQTQLSKRILIAMPILMFAVLSAISPDYMDPMYNSFSGQVALLAASVSMTIGWMVMNKMSKLTA